MFRIRSRRFTTLSCAIAFICILSRHGSSQRSTFDVEKLSAVALRDQKNGLLDAAAQEYQKVLRLHPGVPEVYANLGLVYFAQAKFDQSARALAEAARLRPAMRGVSMWLGIDDVKLNRPAQGATLLREAIRQDPADKVAQSWLVTALWDAGQVDAALLQLRKATAQFPDDPDLLFARGEANGKAATQQTKRLLEESAGTALCDRIYGDHYAENEDWVKAEGHLNRAIERDPASLDARLELAWVFMRQAKLAASQQQVEKAMQLSPRSASALARSGELLLLLQQTTEGVSRIRKALAIDRSEALNALGLPMESAFSQQQAGPELLPLCREASRRLEAEPVSGPAAEVALAALYGLAGDPDAAMRAYQQVGAVQAASAPAASLLAQAAEQTHRHDYDAAEAALLPWLAAHPDDRAARYSLIVVRRNISMAQVTRLLTIAPDSYHVHQLMGQTYLSRDEDDKALSEYLAVAAARPDLPGIHFWLGHLYWKHGDAYHATAELTRELELSPGHPEANAELGTVLVAEERTTEAIPHLESAIRSKPDLWPAYTQLGHAYAMERNYARAEEVLNRALAHDQDASAHYQLAMVFRAEGKTAQAAATFARVRAIRSETMADPSPDEVGIERKQPGSAKAGEAKQ